MPSGRFTLIICGQDGDVAAVEVLRCDAGLLCPDALHPWSVLFSESTEIQDGGNDLFGVDTAHAAGDTRVVSPFERRSRPSEILANQQKPVLVDDQRVPLKTFAW